MPPFLKIAIPLLVAGAIIGGIALALVLAGRGPLAGVQGHDFGVVKIEEERATVEHTFVLVNEGSRPLVIAAIRPSCSCVKVTPDRTIIGAGEAVSLATTFRLSGTGEKKVTIDLMLDVDGKERRQPLWVKGIGERQQTLWSRQQSLIVRPHAASPLEFFAESLDDSSEPSTPVVVTPEGVRAEFAGWTREQTESRRKHRPTVWKGVLRVTVTGPALPPGSQMRLEVENHPALTVDLAADESAAPAIPLDALERRGG